MLTKRFKTIVAASFALPLLGLGAGTAAAQGAHSSDRSKSHNSSLQVRTVLSGANLMHSFTGASGTQSTEALAGPDDLTRLGNELFVAFQNGVGPQGQPSSDGNTASTVVGFSPQGKVQGQWDVIGKVDGLTADRQAGRLIATVNEDANSSLYIIDPSPGTLQHYTYDQSPLPHNGGTDSIAVYGNLILISASAPGTPSTANQNPPAAPQPQYPAVYAVVLDPETSVASVSPLFFGESTATAANGSDQGQTVTLGLTDPDSSEIVPGSSPRFAHDFVLDSQGDREQIYVPNPGGPAQQLSVLALSQSIDDTAWVTSRKGTLYASVSSANAVDAVSGTFTPGTAYVAATPCGANSAPANCTTPNFLATLNLRTGQVTPVTQVSVAAGAGLMFVPSRDHGSQGDQRR
jgi:hypothetical protein